MRPTTDVGGRRVGTSTLTTWVGSPSRVGDLLFDRGGSPVLKDEQLDLEVVTVTGTRVRRRTLESKKEHGYCRRRIQDFLTQGSVDGWISISGNRGNGSDRGHILYVGWG